ncbi:hypothetical protein GHT06_010195 [Daphnia sinensis]|uniref:SCP domain-containing protein n=1 Tax=Daphnia sinensis TaxID=1820382 RepID=A0AAD5PWR5_9CRUS|nr:hypothetical protein GHT06_010195 [Daphnia sinensis]
MEFTHRDIDTIVGLHNRLRRHVASGKESRGSPGPQPKATYMPDLVWDDGLANAAWQWVQNCQFYHDPSLHAMQMGQNIAITMSSERSTTPNWADAAIHPWYAEVEHMDCRHVIKFKNFEAANRQTIRHFTQLIWARTKAVGCAAIGYTNYATPGTPFRVMYVCNYSPPENIIGQPVYEVDSSIPSCREE